MRMPAGTATARSRAVHTLALSLALATLLACNHAPGSDGPDLKRKEQRATATLRTHTDAASLAAAAVLEYADLPAEALSLAHRTALATDQPEWAWLDLSMCTHAPACDPLPAELRFQQLDPDNGAGWLGALQRAYDLHDDAGVDAALAAIGKTSQVNMFDAPLTVQLTRVMANTGDLALPIALMLVIGAPRGGPPHVFMDALHACQEDALKRPGRPDACRAAAVSFQNGDSYLSEITGIAMASGAWPADSPQYRAAEAASRVNRYRTHQLLKAHNLFLPILPSLKQAREYLDLLSRYPRSADMMAAQLAALHMDPTPPPDWKPKASR